MNGSVAPVSVFVSHCPADEAWRLKVARHLRALGGRIDVWDVTDIPPGADRGAVIQKEIESRDVALLLISADYLTSEEYEFQVSLLRRSKTTGLRIIPVICGASVWWATDLGQLQPWPHDGQPLNGMLEGPVDKALADLALKIWKPGPLWIARMSVATEDVISAVKSRTAVGTVLVGAGLLTIIAASGVWWFQPMTRVTPTPPVSPTLAPTPWPPDWEIRVAITKAKQEGDPSKIMELFRGIRDQAVRTDECNRLFPYFLKENLFDEAERVAHDCWEGTELRHRLEFGEHERRQHEREKQ